MKQCSGMACSFLHAWFRLHDVCYCVDSGLLNLWLGMRSQETLGKAEEIFGPENKDLYSAFEGILSRHLPT